MQANNVQILVLDFGSQYTQLIARRLREYGVYTEIVPYFEKLDSIKAKNPKGIILSGGPASVYEKDAYKPDSKIFTLGIPILGICYGMQLIAQHFGGRVIKADAQEFGKAVLEIMESYADKDSKVSSYPAFQGASQGTQAPINLSFTLFSHSKFPQMLTALLDLWEDSVRASHTFLNNQHIAEIKIEVKAALQSSQNIITATDKKDFLGFVGVEDNKIEMLFVASSAFRKGVGKALLKEALERYLKDYPCILVDCNEQNAQGLAFYKSLGFKKIGMSEKDSAGRDFPIAHLKTDKTTLKKALERETSDSVANAFVCKSERVFLRPYTQADFAALHKIVSDKETMVAWGHGFSKKESEEWLEKQLAHYQQYGFGILAIVEKQSGKIIGNAGLNHTEISLKGKTQKIVEIGYLLHRDFWGKGYGSEVARMCAKYGFETLGLEEVYCLIKEDNLSSLKVAKKLSMQKVGEYPKPYKGKKINHLVFKLDKNVWQESKNNATQGFKSCSLFKNVKQDSIVWMSHADKVESIPQGFRELARSGNTHYCAIADSKRKIYALQFHPEVVHSECGGQMLQNFAVGICGADTSWNMRNFAQNEIEKLRHIVYGSKIAQETLGFESQEVGERVRCAWATDKDAAARKLYEDYHDTEWGEPLHEDKKLFEFLILEGFQAGLSWITILKKREAFRVAFDDFDYHKIAAYNESKIESLMQNEGIIRNRAKIEAAISNAKAFMVVQREFGSFDKYIWGFVGGKPIINTFESIADLPASTPLSDTIAKDLKKRGFKFVGTTIVYAFMQAVGMVNDHLTSCYCRTDSKSAKSSFKGRSILDEKCGLQGKSQGSLLNINDRSDFTPLPHLSLKDKSNSKVLCAVSGGVDSSVVAALLYRAIGENLIPVFVDTGLLRKGEREAVEKMFRENLKVPLITADVSALFLSRLKGVLDPEIKRKIIGETFIEVFEQEAKKHNTKGEIKFLAQGTLYPDVIESVSVKGPSKTIKSHHNVGGLPEWMKFELIEPLRELFKDEVRTLGRELGMPESMLMRHPFPGPGLAIRIMGEVNKKDLDLLREADSIFIEELHKKGYYDKVWQAFCVLLNVRSVGVMGDNRTYDNTICVRAVEAIDGMTATFAHLPHDFLESVSNRIINEVEGINRVVYDITSKPPGTIEWE